MSDKPLLSTQEGGASNLFRCLFILTLLTSVALLVTTIVYAVKANENTSSDSVTTSCQTPFVQGVSNGAVSSTNKLATQAGLAMLKAGGNAADAAAVVQWMLNVVQPSSTGIGGGCFILYYDKNSDQVYTIDGREEAPARFNETSFCANSSCLDDANCECNNGAWNFADLVASGHSAGVPGTLHAFHTLMQDFGTKSWAETFQPAIDTAKNGFPMYSWFYNSLINNQNKLKLWPSTTTLFYPNNGLPVPVGQTFQNPDLANTFQLIADNGIEVFYTGAIANDIVNTVKQARNNNTGLYGVMELEDLGNYSAVYREPIVSTFGGYQVYGFPPPSSGGISLAYMLNILELFNLTNFENSYSSVEYLHRIIDAQDVAFSDRNTYVADADFIDVPITGLISKLYTQNRGSTLLQALRSARSANGGSVQSGSPPNSTGEFAQMIELLEKGTTHFAVTDKWGNIATITTTIESGFGNGLVVPGRGFLLNNELTDFNLIPVNLATGQKYANRPQGGKTLRRTALKGMNETYGGKRPMSSMTPTLIMQNYSNKWIPYLSIGSPGGSYIIGQVLNPLLYVLVGKMCIGDAVSQLRVIGRNQPQTAVEPYIYNYSTTVNILNQRGFNLSPFNQSSLLGEVSILRFLPSTIDNTIKYMIEATSDPRSAEGLALGY